MDISKAFLPFSPPPYYSFLYCFRLCLTLLVLYPFTSVLHVSPFLPPPLIPSSLSIILSFHLHFLNYLPFFPSLLYFLSFFPSLASSLIFLLTLYIFPTHRPNHSKVKGMVTVLCGREGMER